jgi:hypothetical protein
VSKVLNVVSAGVENGSERNGTEQIGTKRNRTEQTENSERFGKPGIEHGKDRKERNGRHGKERKGPQNLGEFFGGAEGVAGGWLPQPRTNNPEPSRKVAFAGGLFLVIPTLGLTSSRRDAISPPDIC